MQRQTPASKPAKPKVAREGRCSQSPCPTARALAAPEAAATAAPRGRMQYRHVFHAGNFADVHKHVALLALIARCRRRPRASSTSTPTPALACTTSTAPTRATAVKARRHPGCGDAAARGSSDTDPRHQRLPRGARPRSATATAQAHGYPGSPLLAAAQLRAVDHAICVESQAQTGPRAAARVRPARARAARHAARGAGDGYAAAARRSLPPPQRRGLVLIDPPYEQRRRGTQIATALAAASCASTPASMRCGIPSSDSTTPTCGSARLLRGISPTGAGHRAAACTPPTARPASTARACWSSIRRGSSMRRRAPGRPQLHDLLGGPGRQHGTLADP